MTRKIEVQPEPTGAEIAAQKREAFRKSEGVLSKAQPAEVVHPEPANMEAEIASTKEDYKKEGGARMAHYPNWVRKDH